MWKAFHELQEMGWIPADVVLPKMICVQATGCKSPSQSINNCL